jgi:hypothetical protein
MLMMLLIANIIVIIVIIVNVLLETSLRPKNDLRNKYAPPFRCGSRTGPRTKMARARFLDQIMVAVGFEPTTSRM